MLKSKKIFFLIGTTAELIKLVPVMKELSTRSVPFKIITTGQNDIRFEEFIDQIQTIDIVYSVRPKSKDSSLFLFFIWSVRSFLSLLIKGRELFRELKKSNSFFIVHGDTVSSLIGSVIAKIYGLRIVHIESGLRSFNFLEPFPEEINRFFVSLLADIHFCPNNWALNNLKKTSGSKVNTYQNTLIETFQHAFRLKSHHPLLLGFKKDKKKYFVLVVHRQEHVFFRKRQIIDLILKILEKTNIKFHCIFLSHDVSENFINAVYKFLPSNLSNKIIKIFRLPYVDFIHLLNNAEFVITDGGSNQEELYYMGKPCLILRSVTERVEGLNENVVLSKKNIDLIEDFIDHYRDFQRKQISIKIRPSKIIVDYLSKI